MALGAEDVEPARVDHLVALGERTRFVLTRGLLHLRLDVDLGKRRKALLVLTGLDRSRSSGLRCRALVCVPFQDVVPREHLGVAAEDDVGAATGHVGRDRDRALSAGLGDDVRLALVLLRVEDVERNALLLEEARERVGLLDARRADEDGLTSLAALGDLVGDRQKLLALGLVDEVLVVEAGDGLVRRDDDDVELVGLVELGRLGVGGAGHAAELLVEPEEVLERDGRERAVLVLDPDVLLRLDRLVQPVGPAAPGERRAR